MMQLHNPPSANVKPAAVLVIGGGIGGMRASLDLANSGLKVYLIEQTPCLGGRVAQLGFMFPQHDCVLCRGTPDHGYGCTRPSISPAYIHHNQHPNIDILTSTRLIDLEGQAGDFTVSLKREPQYVNPERCINCGLCASVCPIELPDDYQLGMTNRKAVYKVAPRSAPDTYVIDRGTYCDDCLKCVSICPSQAIDLEEKPRLFGINVGAIILAIGFKTFDPSPYAELGYGRYPNVISAMEYERLVSRSGPTEGIITRPSDGKQPTSIAWLQCIGSRDQTNNYCSSICCMYSTKEAILAKQRLGEEVECSIFVMDERAFNKEYSKYLTKAREKHHIQYQYCRISEIKEDPRTKNLKLTYSDPDGTKHSKSFEIVILATGLQPAESAPILAKQLNIELNEQGFCETDKFTPLQTSRPGVFVCGAFSSPKEISETILDASGAAAEVMRLLNAQLNTHLFTNDLPFLYGGKLPQETRITDQPARVGVFACNCGKTLSDALNFPSMVNDVATMPDVVDAQIIEFACFPEGIEQIKKTIQDKHINRVVIGGCSNRTHDSLFQRTVREVGLNPYLLEMVNIREQCANVHLWQKELANQKAVELLRIAVGRVHLATPIHKKKHRSRPVALVIGGGVAGMVASLTIADSGYQVHLVEKSEMLGGNLTNLYYVAEAYNPQRLLRDMVNRVRSHQLITTHTRSEVAQHDGHVGYFRSTIRSRLNNGSIEDIYLEHGVTIIATGGQELNEHSLLSLPNVITQRNFEDIFIHNPEKIAALNDVVMIQCVDPEHGKHYCSRVCCTNTMKNAIRLKLFNPECRVTVMFKDIVTYGFRETFYTEARRHGVIFMRYTDDNPPEVSWNEEKASLSVRVFDHALNKTLDIPADLIPLAMPIIPSRGTKDLAEMFNVPISSEGFFKEAQLKLRPMDFMREGIFLAGMAAYPKFTEESITHAMAAAAHALPLLAQESLFLGGVVAQVDPEKCVGCLTCTRVCPFSIPQVISEEGRVGVGGLGGAAFIDSAQCQGCGTCTGECPANAIQLLHYTDQQIMLSEINGLGAWQTSFSTG